MSYGQLASLGVICRPISGPRPRLGGKRSPFSAKFETTLAELGRELRWLHARRIVLEVDVDEREIRVDGFPRRDARPASPAVVLSFDSHFGPLRYATGEFNDWRDNLRAIALSMEALRRVDRYGVSRRGEQYVGWKALPVSTDPADAVQTREQALAVLAPYGGDVRAALRATHPDAGGDETEFRRVVKARDLLRGGTS
jgi:hypothetical protein